MERIKTMVVSAMALLLIISAKVTIAESPIYEHKEKTPEELITYYANMYGADVDELLKVAQCESKMGKDNIGDSGNAIGLYQYWNDTWLRFSKLLGEDLDINNMNDQARLTAYIFANHPELKTHWTSYVAIKNGGVYSFYSKKLGRHFKVYCK